MRMTQVVRVLNRQTGQIVEAELISDVSPALVVDAQRRWNSYRGMMLEQRSREGIGPPENSEWDWTYKLSTSDPDEIRFFAIDLLGRVEGLMMLAVVPQASRQEGRDRDCILYVEFLEAAPWNQPEYAGAKAQYKGIGISLLSCAVERSMEAGCGGAIGLHSLSTAEAFYGRLQFDDLGFDAVEGYRYFELSAKAAQILKGDLP